ncbi:hypothetical protein B6D60_04375 [candidate division KSB1 bacterium 4484_87]|nr:MAG: hypothetical protein B6D60_04375 [candidate division KSB1 bacterium 4484_87]
MGTKHLAELIATVNGKLFILSAFLFFCGIFLSPPVVRFSIKLLTAYPLWIWRKINRLISSRPSFFLLAVFIFIFNSFSAFANILSGFCVVLPFIFALWTGLNIGIIIKKESDGIAAIVALFLSPHAFFELPAIWLSMAAGMQIGLAAMNGKQAVFDQFHFSLNIYFYLILPLLCIAAAIEAGLFYWANKKSHDIANND